MVKIGFIVPYFGKFPNTFYLWLQCCKNNPDIEWFIFTDDRMDYPYPLNVKVIYTTLSEMKIAFEQKLGFQIALDRSYKLCDYRPLYGVLFSEYLKECTHWGYCDTDLLFGNLLSFFSDEILRSHKKVNVLGHISVYENSYAVNHVYEQCDYKAVFQDERNRTFDEVRFEPNINSIMRNAEMSVCADFPYADIGADHYNFHLHEYRQGNRTSVCEYYPTVFCYRDGRTYQCMLVNGNVVEKEIAYVHFQKRYIQCDVNAGSDFVLIPNRIINGTKIDKKLIESYSHDNYAYYIRQLYKRTKRAIISRIHAR